MKKLLSLIFVSLLLSGNAYAGINVDDYLKTRANKNKAVNDFIDADIMGIGTGILWSNVSIRANKGKPMYCSPPNMSLTNQNYINFLDQEIEDEKNKGTLSGKEEIGMLIIKHMRRIFPCEN